MTDYARCEDVLKRADALLTRAWNTLEAASDHLPEDMSVIAAEEKIRQSRKMINNLRAALDRHKTGERNDL
jgi:hypothetical protein